jgi:lipopolysaccharide transport system permease protein
MEPASEFDLVIEAGKSERHYWRDLWRYRELLYFLAWRDLLVRYKQTAIGVIWALTQPLLTMVVFTFVFGRIAKLSSGTVPYPLLVLSAILPWQFFSSALSETTNSLISNSNLLAKVYFPRLIVPVSAVVVCFVDFLISAVIVVGLFAWYHVVPDWRIVFLPAFILLGFLASFGIGIVLTTVNVKYRDFRYVVPFIIQLGLYVSPVGFSASIVPEKWRLLYSLNPMVGVIEGFRWSLFGGESALSLPGIAISVVLLLVILFVGIRYFRKTERTFADVL